MKLLAIAAAAFAVAAPSKTVQLALVHAVSGCHVWQVGPRTAGATATIRLKRGDRIQLRVNCPMQFRIELLRGPNLAFGDARFDPGTLRSIVFAKKGVYVLRATNLQSSEQVGLQTLGADNTPTLTVRVS
ncbi:MAG TPA: hypothetical protein VI408_01870 [Gaiellaceae bacterium]